MSKISNKFIIDDIETSFTRYNDDKDILEQFGYYAEQIVLNIAKDCDCCTNITVIDYIDFDCDDHSIDSIDKAISCILYYVKSYYPDDIIIAKVSPYFIYRNRNNDSMNMIALCYSYESNGFRNISSIYNDSNKSDILYLYINKESRPILMNILLQEFERKNIDN